MIPRYLAAAISVGVAVALTILFYEVPSDPVDLSGTYDTATLTPLERPSEFGSQLEVSPTSSTGRRFSQAAAERPASFAAESDDRGDEYLQIDGMFRTSLITWPENGRLPEFTSHGEARFRANLEKIRDSTFTVDVWWLDDPAGPYDGPEDRPLEERCLLDGAGSAGPPALPARHNNIKRIIQTEDSVLIVNEMIHDARIVRLNSTHLPPEIRKWMGDSIGWWEDGTLVVETTNFREETGLFMAGEDLRVVERFQRIDDQTLLYRFRVEEPAIWRDGWEGEYLWHSTSGLMYEYACHEGNYSLPGILKGARESEKRALGKRHPGSAPH